MKKEDERRAHVAFDFAGRTVSVVDGKTMAEMKRASGVVPELQQRPKGLNRIVQDRNSKGGAAARAPRPGGSVPVAPDVAAPPVYARVPCKRGAAPVALSREDGSLDRFLEALRFQQLEDGYFQDDNSTKSSDAQEGEETKDEAKETKDEAAASSETTAEIKMNE